MPRLNCKECSYSTKFRSKNSNKDLLRHRKTIHLKQNDQLGKSTPPSPVGTPLPSLLFTPLPIPLFTPPPSPLDTFPPSPVVASPSTPSPTSPLGLRPSPCPKSNKIWSWSPKVSSRTKSEQRIIDSKVKAAQNFKMPPQRKLKKATPVKFIKRFDLKNSTNEVKNSKFQKKLKKLTERELL